MTTTIANVSPVNRPVVNPSTANHPVVSRQQWLAERKQQEGWFDVSTLKEPFRIEGKKTMGYELVEQLGWEYPDAVFYPTGGGVGLIGMVFVLLTYGGWNEAAYISAELAGGRRAIVSALVTSLAIIAACYLLVNLAVRTHAVQDSPTDPAGGKRLELVAARRIETVHRLDQPDTRKLQVLIKLDFPVRARRIQFCRHDASERQM